MTEPRSERGAVAVEFALVLPILMMILLGIVEFGLSYSAQLTITNAAREGARTMAIQNNAGSAVASVIGAAPHLSSIIKPTDVSVTPALCVAGQTVSVQIHYPYKFLTGFFGAGYTMVGTAAMRCGG
jgi:Flp pilus assembly protein TadG